MEIWNLFEYIYLGLVFITFWYFFYFVKFVCGEMLASRLWKSLLFLTLVGLFHECFACVLPSSEYHFNSLLLILFFKAAVRLPALLSRVLQKPVISILLQFNWLVATWCEIWVWEISEQITSSFISFLFFVYLSFTFTAPSWVFFQYVSYKLFRWYLVILIGLLTWI